MLICSQDQQRNTGGNKFQLTSTELDIDQVGSCH